MPSAGDGGEKGAGRMYEKPWAAWGLLKKYGTTSENLWSPMTMNGRGPRRKAWEGRSVAEGFLR